MSIASKEEFSSYVESHMNSGDLIFFSRNASYESFLIRAASLSGFDHVGVVCEANDFDAKIAEVNIGNSFGYLEVGDLYEKILSCDGNVFHALLNKEYVGKFNESVMKWIYQYKDEKLEQSSAQKVHDICCNILRDLLDKKDDFNTFDAFKENIFDFYDEDYNYKDFMDLSNIKNSYKDRDLCCCYFVALVWQMAGILDKKINVFKVSLQDLINLAFVKYDICSTMTNINIRGG